MKVLVDARMVGAIGNGIANYVTEIAKSLLDEPKNYELQFLTSPELPKAHPIRNFFCIETNISFLHPREIISLTSVIREAGPDLYHSPSFSSLVRYPCPYVQTVHDLNHLHYGSFLQRAYYQRLLFPSMKRAKTLLTVSGSAKAEIQIWLNSRGVQKEIFVARNVIEDPPRSTSLETLRKFGLNSRNYFLSLSNAKPHKNLTMLEKAHRMAHNPLPLVLNIFGDSTKSIKTGPLLDHELQELLQNAKAFFFPSLYEGFGRPPLEAALAGVQPIASDISPHREGLSGVLEAEFIPPQNLELWKNAFEQKSQDCVKSTSEESKIWIRQEYSLKRLGQTMNEIYQRTLSKG